MVHAGERATYESGEHKVLGPPRVLPLDRTASKAASRRAIAVHRDVELEDPRRGRHPQSD
jgi:hypothetical protein